MEDNSIRCILIEKIEDKYTGKAMKPLNASVIAIV
jgi:hypothetical protein